MGFQVLQRTSIQADNNLRRGNLCGLPNTTLPPPTPRLPFFSTGYDAGHCSTCSAVQHVWPWLYDDAEDRRLFTALQSQLKFIHEFVQSGSAALHHLESELVAAACTDPSVEMEKQLVLPLIRDRIHAAAKDVSRAQDQDQSENTVRAFVPCVCVAMSWHG